MRSDTLGFTSTESGGAGVGGSPTDVLEGGGWGLRVGMVGSATKAMQHITHEVKDCLGDVLNTSVIYMCF